MGNRTSIKDPNGRITSFKYNEYNLCTEKTLPGGEKAKIEYDEKGRMTCQIDFSGQKAKYYYNTQGLLQKQQLFTANSDSVYKEIAFSYDELGRKKEIKTTDFSKSNANNETIISLSYDVRGNVIKRSTPEGTVNYSYDLQSGQKNRVWCERSVDGVNKTSTDIRYTYDEIYRLKSITVHCRNGEQLQVPEVTSFTYTKTGTRESIERPNGIKTLYQYNLLDRLIKLSHSNETEKIAEYIYSLDASGRRVGVSEEILQPGGERVSATIAYEYDGLGRLIQEERVGGGSFLATYKYDLCNNRLKKQQTINGISETIDYSYDQNDKLIKETSSISGVTEYIYDSNGSVINKYNENQFSYQFAYDPQNRLISSTVSRKEGEQKEINVNISSTYSYDYEGNQVGISQTINGTTEQRFNLIDSGLTGYPQVFEEMSAAAGTTLNSYIIGDDIIYQTNSASTIYFLYDGHGSTRQLANENSAISEIYNYDAYGQILNGGVGAIYQTAATSLLYSGEIFDAGIQMQNLRTRYYDPSLGRFVQQDSFEGDINKPQSLHKYGYVYADPVNYIDPSGEFAAGIFLDLANVGFRMANFIAALSLLNEASISGATLNRIAREERTQEKATLIVHGVTGKNEGWASAFINSLSSDSYTGSMATGNLEKIPGATTNDFYEYTWSGFSLPLVAMPVISVHRIAYINLIYSSIVIWMKGYEKINVIAHSWGTTLTYDLLSSGGIVFNDWITMGSPLKNTTPRPAMLGGRWINYWCTTDPVCFFAMYPPWQLIPNVAAPGLMLNDNVSHGCNHKVPGTEHMIWAHSVYWNNDFVINSIKNYIR